MKRATRPGSVATHGAALPQGQGRHGRPRLPRPVDAGGDLRAAGRRHDPNQQGIDRPLRGARRRPLVRHRQRRAETCSAASSTGARLAPDRPRRSSSPRWSSRIPIGLFAGYRGGRTDNAIMRIMDALSSIPFAHRSRSRSSASSAPGIDKVVIALSIVLHPGIRAPDPRADAGGAGGDVHRGVALDRDSTRARILLRTGPAQRRVPAHRAGDAGHSVRALLAEAGSEPPRLRHPAADSELGVDAPERVRR